MGRRTRPVEKITITMTRSEVFVLTRLAEEGFRHHSSFRAEPGKPLSDAQVYEIQEYMELGKRIRDALYPET